MKKTNETKNAEQFIQVVVARGESSKKLLEWAKLHSLFVLRMPFSDLDTIGIIGSGEYFSDVFTDELACSCIDKFKTFQEGSCLKELVIYLAERTTHGSATSFS